MMQLIPYRDKFGYIIAKNGIYDPKRKKLSGGYTPAVLIFCPERNALLAIKHCEKCGLYAGQRRLRGVNCKSIKKPVFPFPSYAKTRESLKTKKI